MSISLANGITQPGQKHVNFNVHAIREASLIDKMPRPGAREKSSSPVYVYRKTGHWLYADALWMPQSKHSMVTTRYMYSNKSQSSSGEQCYLLHIA